MPGPRVITAFGAGLLDWIFLFLAIGVHRDAVFASCSF
jgi:hypothetical protein